MRAIYLRAAFLMEISRRRFYHSRIPPMLSTNRATRPLSSRAFTFISEGRALASTCSDKAKRRSLHLENKPPPRSKRMSVDEIYLQSHEMDFQMAQFITQIKKVEPVKMVKREPKSAVTPPKPKPIHSVKWKSAEKAQKKYVNDFEYRIVPRHAPSNKASFFKWFKNDAGGNSNMASCTWSELNDVERQSFKEGHFDVDLERYASDISKLWSSVDVLSKPKSNFGKFCVRNMVEILEGNAHLENNIPEYLKAAELKWREKKVIEREAKKARQRQKNEKDAKKQVQQKKAKKAKKQSKEETIKNPEPVHKPSVKDIISQFESLSKGIQSLKPHSKKMKKAFKDALSHSTVQGVSKSVQMFESMTRN